MEQERATCQQVLKAELSSLQADQDRHFQSRLDALEVTYQDKLAQERHVIRADCLEDLRCERKSHLHQRLRDKLSQRIEAQLRDELPRQLEEWLRGLVEERVL